jgi:hypothetical protein
LESLIASRTFITGMLTAIGIAIAFGPEIRLAVARIRRDGEDASEDVSQLRARAR